MSQTHELSLKFICKILNTVVIKITKIASWQNDFSHIFEGIEIK